VLFAMLVFALMAAAAVAIDVGAAGLAQAQMQDAVDTAALEGQRWRQYAEFQHDSDRNRRLKSNEMASLVFDDDLDPTNGDPMGFGAGAVLDVTPSSGGQPLLQVPKNSVYKPELQPNWGDLPFGDMISGSFDIAAPGAEDGDYARADFTPSTTASERWLGDGFLVRMRRSSVDYGNDQIPLKSSRGPGVPVLFGLGAAISAGEGAAYDPRAHGLTVRATAVAAARPALSVGETPRDLDGNLIPQSSGDVLNFYDHLGVTPFAISLEFWNRYTLDDPACVVVDVITDTEGNTRGRLRLFDEDLQTVGETIGWFVEGMLQVGNALTPAGPPSALTELAPRLDGFIPIFTDIDGTSRVVGFGHGVLWDPSFSASEQCQSTIGVMKTISKFDTRLPLTGSSALLLYPTDMLTADEWRQVFNLNRAHFTTDRLDASILAPALAR
jgi:hypothetical protein